MGVFDTYIGRDSLEVQVKPSTGCKFYTVGDKVPLTNGIHRVSYNEYIIVINGRLWDACFEDQVRIWKNYFYRFFDLENVE